ncbi:hypothetical protein R3P38DRAFT_2786921 [Favolaschia claudopus]|uniref:Ribonuclease H1 N-terminal domain-containing protein n=1 Tax=Favolaschia claudopus TaxID=2862362 RepID=A0AAW0ARF3_9AGAR
MPHNGPPCLPMTFNHGANLHDHDLYAEGHYWVVISGHAPGIYLDHGEAEIQVFKVHNMRWKRFDNAEAVEYWDTWCRLLHDHGVSKWSVEGFDSLFDSYDAALAAAASRYISPN